MSTIAGTPRTLAFAHEAAPFVLVAGCHACLVDWGAFSPTFFSALTLTSTAVPTRCHSESCGEGGREGGVARARAM